MNRQAKAQLIVLLALTLLHGLTAPGLLAAGAQEERIPFALPALRADKMPSVFFSHERHVKWSDKAGKDCTVCHVDGASGMSEYFMDSEKMPAHGVISYTHQQCVACHASIKKGEPSGPRLASCRSCHDSGIAKAQAAVKKP